MSCSPALEEGSPRWQAGRPPDSECLFACVVGHLASHSPLAGPVTARGHPLFPPALSAEERPLWCTPFILSGEQIEGLRSLRSPPALSGFTCNTPELLIRREEGRGRRTFLLG